VFLTARNVPWAPVLKQKNKIKPQPDQPLQKRSVTPREIYRAAPSPLAYAPPERPPQSPAHRVWVPDPGPGVAVVARCFARMAC